MKILIVSQRWYPDTFGGSEHVASEQARYLAARGHSVTVLTEKARDSLRVVEEKASLVIYRYGSERQFARFGGRSRTDLREVSRLLRDNSIIRRLDNSKEQWWDAAILHHPFPAAGFFKSGLRIPALYVFHASTPKEAELEGISRSLPVFLEPLRPIISRFFVRWSGGVEREVLKQADKIAVFSEFSRRLVSSISVSAGSKIVRLSVGIDQERFRPEFSLTPTLSQRERGIESILSRGERGIDPPTPPESPPRAGGEIQWKEARHRLALPQNKKIILTVRRFSPRMGIGALIDAMKPVRAALPDAQLMIVGEGPLKSVLQRKIEKEGLQGYVTLMGTVPLEDLPLYYQAADLFVLPTEAFEGLGMATLEALACGVPVVGTPSGATPEVLRDLDVGLITHGTGSEDLARGILDFFARPEAEREALGKKARALVEKKYRWDRAVEELEGVLEGLSAKQIKQSKH